MTRFDMIGFGLDRSIVGPPRIEAGNRLRVSGNRAVVFQGGAAAAWRGRGKIAFGLLAGKVK